MEGSQLVEAILDGLRSIGPGDVTPDQHRAMLRNVFILSALPNREAERGTTAAQVRRCMELIERGIPVSLNGPMSCFLEAVGWYGDELVRELFTAYVRAGYIELNRAPSGVALPLEAAVSRSHLDFFRAALECGADERLVPTASNRIRYQSSWDEDEDDDEDKPCEVHDIHDLISHDVRLPEMRAAMAAVLHEVAMNRRIRESCSGVSLHEHGAASGVPLEPSLRRRRNSL